MWNFRPVVMKTSTTGLFSWKLLSNESFGVNVSVYNSMGKEQLNQSFPTPTQTREGTIDLSRTETGVYFLKFNVGEKNIVRKIIKN